MILVRVPLSHFESSLDFDVNKLLYQTTFFLEVREQSIDRLGLKCVVQIITILA